MRGMIAGELLSFIPLPPRTGPRVKKDGATDAAARLADTDSEGIDVMAMYPTKGLYIFGVKDPELAAALARA